MNNYSFRVFTTIVVMKFGLLFSCVAISQSSEELESVVAQCGGGISVRIDGNLEVQIADAYQDSRVLGDQFVFDRIASIFSDLPPDQAIDFYRIYTDCIKASMSQSSSGYDPGYSEPTEAEMRSALTRALTDRGATDRDGGFEVNNAIAGVRIEILEFSKQDCRVASRGSGYECTYLISTGFGVHSNEGTDAGNRHANALNTLLGLFGGTRSPVHSESRRFIKSGETWFASEK